MWKRLADFLKLLWQETLRGSVASSMWVEGYTDYEIERELQDLFGK